jgi:hypothetical protein
MPAALSSPANNVSSTLAAAHAAGGTSIVLASGAGATISTRLAALGLPSR